MSIASVLSRLTRAMPAILAAAPTVIEAVKQVRQALKKPKPAEAGAETAGGDAPARTRRLSADSGQGAR